MSTATSTVLSWVVAQAVHIEGTRRDARRGPPPEAAPIAWDVYRAIQAWGPISAVMLAQRLRLTDRRDFEQLRNAIYRLWWRGHIEQAGRELRDASRVRVLWRAIDKQ